MKFRIDAGNFSRGEPTSLPKGTTAKMDSGVSVLIDTGRFNNPSEAAAALRRVVDTVLKMGEWPRSAPTPEPEQAKDESLVL